MAKSQLKFTNPPIENSADGSIDNYIVINDIFPTVNHQQKPWFFIRMTTTSPINQWIFHGSINIDLGKLS